MRTHTITSSLSARFVFVVLAALTTMGSVAHAADVPSPQQLSYQNNQLGAFVHFGPATYTGNSDMHATPAASVFNPVDLDAEQWVLAAKSFGAKHIVLTAKHHNGFCLWPTATTDYSVASSPWKSGQGDVVAEFAAAAKANDMQFGIYLSGGDEYEQVTSTPTAMGTRTVVDPNNNYVNYTNMFKEQITEIVTQYGDDLSALWFDGAFDPFGWDVPQPADAFAGTPDAGRHPADVFADLVHTHAPNAVIMGGTQPDLRWSGSEQGGAPYPLNNVVQLGQGVANYLPPDAQGWYISEANIHTRNTWFWMPGSDGTLRSVDYMKSAYYNSIGNGANLLVNLTPDTSGLVPAAEVQRMAEFGAELDRIFSQTHVTTDSSGGWAAGDTLELELTDMKNINHIVLEESIADGQQIVGYAIDAWNGSTWQQKITGQTIGRKRIDAFTPFAAEKIRLRITSSNGTPSIDAMTAYGILDVPVEPGPAMLEDDFDDGVVDATKWISLEVGGGTIIEEDGVMKVNTVGGDRAYLVTADQFDPSKGNVTMTGTLTVTGGDSQWSIWARSSDHYDTAGTMAGTMLSSGVRVAYWDAAQSSGYENIGALIKSEEAWPWDGFGTGVNMPDPYAEEMGFVFTDDGTTVSLTVTDTSDPSNTATWSADTAFDEGNYHIAFSATNMALDNLVITWEAVFLAGDANRDGSVNDADAAILAANWQKSDGAVWADGDFNNDGAVDAADATLLAANWQISPPTSASVPEPGGLLLVVSGLSILLCGIFRKSPNIARLGPVQKRCQAKRSMIEA